MPKLFLLKRFSISTILGLVLGILLAGYVVFAFQAPTQAPPAGNPPTPLNTSSLDQTKTGGTLNVFGLWVNQSLGVTGGAALGGVLNLQGNRIINVGAPSLSGDVATKGFVDTLTGNLQTRISNSCPTGQGIRAVGADGSVTCQSVPVDNDGDGVLVPRDCNDSCPTCYPGSKSYTSSGDGLDQNCDGPIDNRAGNMKSCKARFDLPQGAISRLALELSCASYCGVSYWPVLGGSAIECASYGEVRLQDSAYQSFDWNTCRAGSSSAGNAGSACSFEAFQGFNEVLCMCPGSPRTPDPQTCNSGGSVNKSALLSACENYCGGPATVQCEETGSGSGRNSYDWNSCASSGSTVSGEYCSLSPPDSEGLGQRKATCSCSSPQVR